MTVPSKDLRKMPPTLLFAWIANLEKQLALHCWFNSLKLSEALWRSVKLVARTSCSLSDYSRITPWLLPDFSLITPWLLPDYFLITPYDSQVSSQCSNKRVHASFSLWICEGKVRGTACKCRCSSILVDLFDTLPHMVAGKAIIMFYDKLTVGFTNILK